MAEETFNLLHTLLLTRDLYGFALRPQHTTKYKEYAVVYKEEEKERTEKWKNFLKNIGESDGSTEVDTEKEPHISEGTKTDGTKLWALIRQSLGSIEDFMSSRVKKGTKMKNEQISMTGDNGNVSGLDSASTSWRMELETLVHGGIPRDLRGEVWQAFVGVKARQVERYYEDLLAQVANGDESNGHDESSGIPRKWRKQIEKDIPRTFPGHPALNENGRDSLRRVLLAYARHNPSVGYCQAMNFFAGLLLLLMPEENAFWVFVGIIDEYFEGYYTEDMIESQVDQLVFEELMREMFPKLVNHLDYMGVQVAWFSGPWFLSIFVNMIPWETVLRVWDVLLFEGNRVMLFRTALALMELYGPEIMASQDAGDAITSLQTLAGSTFDSSQLVLTACMGYLSITEARLQELRKKHRPSVLVVIEERAKGQVRKETKRIASKLYSFKPDRTKSTEDPKSRRSGDVTPADLSQSTSPQANCHELHHGMAVDSEVDSFPDLQEQVDSMKVEMSRLLEEKRAAELRAEELETALMEMVKEDNRRELTARVEELEYETKELQKILADKRDQEAVVLEVLMRIEQEQKITEDARRKAEDEAAANKNAIQELQEKYDKAMASLAEMEKQKVVAESLLEATLQYESGQAKALSSPRSVRPQESSRRLSFFGWRDRSKSKTNIAAESSESKPKEGTELDTSKEADASKEGESR